MIPKLGGAEKKHALYEAKKSEIPSYFHSVPMFS